MIIITIMLVTFLFAVPKCLTDRHNLEGKGLCGLRFRGVNLSLSGGHGGRRSREKKCWYLVGCLLFPFIRSGTSSSQGAATYIQSDSFLPQKNLSINDRSVPPKSKPSDSKSSRLTMKINYRKHQLLMRAFCKIIQNT